jgi:hypothetical protein
MRVDKPALHIEAVAFIHRFGSSQYEYGQSHVWVIQASLSKWRLRVAGVPAQAPTSQGPTKESPGPAGS